MNDGVTSRFASSPLQLFLHVGSAPFKEQLAFGNLRFRARCLAPIGQRTQQVGLGFKDPDVIISI